MTKSRISDLAQISELKDVSVKDISLDKENPRIQFAVDSKITRGEIDISKKDIEFFLSVKSKPYVTALKESIESSGGVLDPIWVSKKNNKYIVIEGNTRLLIYRSLAKKYTRDPRWQNIKCRILPADVPADVINFIRLEFHLGGKQPWEPYERARYLYKLSQSGYSLDRLARESRISKNRISEDLKAYGVMNKYFIPEYADKVDNPLDRFSYFVELIGNKKMQKQANMHKFNIEDFTKWVAEDKIPRAIDVRLMPEIISDEQSYNLFKKEGFETAMQLLAIKKPAVALRLFSDIEMLIDKLNNLRLSEVKQIRQDKSKKKYLSDLITASEQTLG